MLLLKITRKLLKEYALFGILFCFFLNGYSQQGFLLPSSVKKDRLFFRLINNLVVIPVEVNGTALTFLLDTGVSSTIMFSMSEVDSLKLNNTESIRLRGLGEGGSIPALKSKNNRLKIGKTFDNDHTVFVIFDKSLNLSTRMGIPIHGIIGYEFFKNLVVTTNYVSKKITVYNPQTYSLQECKKCEIFDLILQNKKAYLNVNVTSDSTSKEVTLLLDSGSSDAIWIFEDQDFKETLLTKSFDDFLGQGLSGEIFGRRSKLSSTTIGDYELKNVKVAFPYSSSMENIQIYEERDGSIGGEILKRFTVTYDYQNKKLILKKNGYYNLPFHYNMSGLTIKHDGVVLVKDKKYLGNSDRTDVGGATNISISEVFNFYLAPKFVVSEIRKDSPADQAGILKGDEIISVNGKLSQRYDLNDLIGLLASKSGKKIMMKVKRNGMIFRKKFYLKEIL